MRRGVNSLRKERYFIRSGVFITSDDLELRLPGRLAKRGEDERTFNDEGDDWIRAKGEGGGS